MRFHWEITIFHYFLNLSLKNDDFSFFFAYPPAQKTVFRVPATQNSRKPSAAPKTEPPNLRGTDGFFRLPCKKRFSVITRYAILGVRLF